MKKSWRVGASLALWMVGCSGNTGDELGGDGGRAGGMIDGGHDTSRGDGDGDAIGDGGGDAIGDGDGDAIGDGDGDAIGDGGGSKPNSDAGTDSDPLASIASFSGPSSACPGSQIALNYIFSGRSGLITPSQVQLTPGSGQASVTLEASTDFVLEAQGAGGPVTAHAMVSALPSPNGTMTSPATAAYNGTVIASVPSQSGVSYAWSVTSGNATIQSGGTSNQATFKVGTTGGSVDLKVDVTGSGNGCVTSTPVSLPIRCALPTLISLDRTQQTATPQYIPSNEGTRSFALNSAGTLWASYLINNSPGVATYNLGFTRRIGGTWSVPAGSPTVLNAASSNVYDVKVATNDAGDAVFVWTDLSGGTNHIKLRSYRVSTNTWSAVKDVGTTWDNGGPVFVALDQDDATGKAVVVWLGGPGNAVVPHVRSYTISTDALGNDIAVRSSTTNNYPNYLMTLDFEANANLDGYLAWVERDNGTNFNAIYALHVTGGAPDSPSAGTYAIQTVVQGVNGNDPNPWAETIQQKTDMFAMSESGNAIVVWRRYNPNDTKWYLMARRFVTGSWNQPEQIAVGAGAISSAKPAIDNQGNAAVATWSNGVNYAFAHAQAGQAWSDLGQLATATSGSAQQGVTLESTTGKGFVVYRDQNAGTAAPLRGAFYDPSTQTLSPSFTISSPVESAPELARVSLDASGKATVLFTQMPATLPQNANSSNSSLEFATTCQ